MENCPRFNKTFIQKVVGAKAARYIRDQKDKDEAEGFMYSIHYHAAVQAYSRALRKFYKGSINEAALITKHCNKIQLIH